MEEEGGSAAIKLLICNYGKPSAVQMSITEKKHGWRFLGCERQNLHKNKSTRCNVSKSKYKDEM